MTAEIGHNSATFGADELRQFIGRIEQFELLIAAAQDERRFVYDELKSHGFDAKAVRAIVKARKQDASERQEHEAIVELYRNALGMD